MESNLHRPRGHHLIRRTPSYPVHFQTPSAQVALALQENTLLTTTLFTFLAAGAALAEPQADRSATREDLLQRLKSLESESHRQRIRIPEEAEDCIPVARDFPAYRACERRENDAREALR